MSPSLGYLAILSCICWDLKSFEHQLDDHYSKRIWNRASRRISSKPDCYIDVGRKQCARPSRVAGAAALAPVIDKGLRRIQNLIDDGKKTNEFTEGVLNSCIA